MTVPGLIDAVEDKEKLVTKVDVTTIMPNRDRLVKIRKRKLCIKLIISLALLLLILSTILLTIYYIKKTGPFKRIFRGRCGVTSQKYSHHKVYESFEITDNYALISVPHFQVKFGHFHSVKTLHVFKKKLIVIQYKGACFVRPMFRSQGLQRDWFERIPHINYDEAPKQFVNLHWQLNNHRFTNDYLRENVHEMAAAMCASRPVYHLKLFALSHHRDYNDRRRKDMSLQSSNQVDKNCKAIRCQNKCNGLKRLGCVQCWCADPPSSDESNHAAKIETPAFNKMIVSAVVGDNEETKPQLPLDMPVANGKVNNQKDSPNGNKPVSSPIFQDLLLRHPVYFNKGTHKRKKRSLDSKCTLVAEVFEGYLPLDQRSKMSVDYIHDCT